MKKFVSARDDVLERLDRLGSSDLPKQQFVQALRRQLMETALTQKSMMLTATPRLTATNRFSIGGVAPDLGRIQRSLGSVGAILIVITIAAGLIFTAAGRNPGNQSPTDHSFAGASIGVGNPATDPDGPDAPGGGYHETQFSLIVLPYTYFDNDLLDGRFATLDSWEVEPLLTTAIDTSSYQTPGIAVAFVLQGALVATFTSQVAITRRVPSDSYTGSWLIEAGQPVELVTGDVIAYEIGQTISIRNPFPSLPTEIMQVVVSDNSLPAIVPDWVSGMTVTRHAEEEMPVLLSTLGAGILVQLSTYWNLAGGEVHEDATRNLFFAPASTGNATPPSHGYVISISEPIG